MARVRGDHLVKLPTAIGSWSAWRWVVLRAAGFPASTVLRLGAPTASSAAQQVLDSEREITEARTKCLDSVRAVQKSASTDAAPSIDKALRQLKKNQVPGLTGTAADTDIIAFQDARQRSIDLRAELGRALESERVRVSAVLRDAASSESFREALVWQNRGALHTAIVSLLAHGTKPSTSNHRKHEQLVASYLQRYCTKNDTIGFFGPVGWARLGSPGEDTALTPGPSIIARRSVHFEQWPIDEVAKKLAADPRAARWMRPRRFPFVRIEGTVVRSAVNGRHELDAGQRIVLAACDGRTTAGELATRLLADHGDAFVNEAGVFDALAVLREKVLIAWTFEVPLTWNPELALRKLLEPIGDEALRAELIAPLKELEDARTRVANAAGDVTELEAALENLDAAFTRVTGAAPTRNAGAMYAARNLVFEDCRRDIDARLGSEVVAAVGPPLSLVLASGRWLTFEAAKTYRAEFRRIYDGALRRSRDGRVAFADVWFGAQRVLFGAKESPIGAVLDELQRRWSEILVIPPGARRVAFDSATLAASVEKAFAAPGPGWCQARHHSPDLMIAATDVDAIARGDFQVVLGELHVGLNTLDSASLTAQHPDPEALERAFASDLPEHLALSVYSKEWLKITVRTNRAFAPTSHAFVENGFDVAPVTRDRVLALSELFVEEEAGELVVRGPGGFSLELVAFLGENMSMLVKNGFRMLPRASHTPRVTIDRLVVARENWRIAPSTMAFAFESTAEGRFLEAQRWARELGLPRFLFVKSAIEVKPMYADLTSPLYVDMLAKLARRTKEHVAGETELSISEMLPGLEQTWISDASGARFTSEFRIVAFDDDE